LGAANHASRGSIGTEGGRRHVGRYGESSRAGPSVIGRPQSGACLQAAGRSLLGPGDNAVPPWNSRAPARQGPSPEKKGTRYTLKDFQFTITALWFESTPRNAPRLPIQTNNHTTSEPHTHVMSNENKFPLKKKTQHERARCFSLSLFSLFSRTSSGQKHEMRPPRGLGAPPPPPRPTPAASRARRQSGRARRPKAKAAHRRRRRPLSARSVRDPKLVADAAGAQLGVVTAEGLDQVAALPVAQLELKALTLSVPRGPKAEWSATLKANRSSTRGNSGAP